VSMLTEVLVTRFGELDEVTRLRLESASPDQLLAMARNAASASNLKEVFRDNLR
jgi:hypothetical protein